MTPTETVAEKIDRVLTKRREQMPIVESKLNKWQLLKVELDKLESAIETLVNYKNAPAEIKHILQYYKNASFQRYVRESIEAFEKVRERMKRNTVNIGVSGQARVGKSTLLQTISGLSDEQVPTGSGIPVTAVRSRIFHSEQRSKAAIKFHDYSSFRDNILIPYHNELNLESPPLTLQDYQMYKYSLSDDALKNLSPKKESLYIRLKDMHNALSSYKEYLSGEERIFDLVGIRKFVAYPTNEQEKLSDCPRTYLAVQDVRIECKFPQLTVQKIGLIDLPGLGELSAGAEEHHVRGLQNEVDFVLFVKRPVEGMAYWRKEDAIALDVLDEARGAIKKRGDFVHIISNENNLSSELVDAMLGDILRKANSGVDGKNYKVLRANVKDVKEVYQYIVNPVLEHLADRLPIMDKDILSDATQSSHYKANAILLEIQEFSQRLRNAIPASTASAELFDELSKILHERVAYRLGQIVDNLFKQARSKDEDDDYIKAVQNAESGVKTWIYNGFGFESKEKWLDHAVFKMAVPGGSAGFSESDFNRIRVYISEQFSNLDKYFKAKVQSLWTEIGNVLTSETDMLLKTEDDNNILQMFRERLTRSGEECPTLLNAVQDMLDLEIKYRTHLHPRVRKCLDLLRYHLRDSDTDKLKPQVTVSKAKEGADEIYENLKIKAEQAVYQTRKALFSEADFIALILHAAVEQFDDSFIRSGNSEKEIKRFARSYRDEIWPDKFIALDSQNARISGVNKALQSVLNTLNDLVK